MVGKDETKEVSMVGIPNNSRQIQEEISNLRGPLIGYRHVQVALLSFALIVGIGSKTNFSVAIVAMTDNTTNPNAHVPTYEWHNNSVILSSFFWSYIALQIVAGYLGRAYGPKYFLLVALFINFLACTLIPTAAEYLGSGGVMLCRIIQGLGVGFLHPSLNVLMGQWVPKQERSSLFTITLIGISIGTMASSLMTGYVAASSWGWPASFYILAAAGFSWCILWLIFGENSPATHPKITVEEKNYIQSSLKQQDNTNPPTPWKAIFTCVPFYALMVANTAHIWGHAILMTETPTYLSKIMNFKIKKNALATSLPNVLSMVSSLIVGPMADWVITKKILSPLNARRIFNLIGSYGQALLLIWLSFLKPSQSHISILILCLSNVILTFVTVGSSVNHLDLSSRYSGEIYGILNTVGQCFSIIGPLTTNWIVTDPTNVSQWQTVFIIAAGFYIFGATVFFFFASATPQPWDSPNSQDLKYTKTTSQNQTLYIISHQKKP